jgi:hypothetical protein
MIIAIDFDGTVVKHKYPFVGDTVDGSVRVLKKLVENKHKLILWTMRSGNELEDAVEWFKSNDIPLYGKNYNPGQQNWTKSPKAYAQLYIDDAALGCPLIHGEDRPYVNWDEVENYLIENKII